MVLDNTSHAPPIARTIQDLRTRVQAWRWQGETVALIPTMGALHEGHLSLVDMGKQQADKVIVSIFVNPSQFGPGEDFDAYPRTEKTDVDKLNGRTDLVFAPNGAEMYPAGFSTIVTVDGLTRDLEATSRPAHFSGVTTIVAKLLLSCLPDIAVFGEKDYQQLLVIKHMVRDLNIPVTIAGCPIAREQDGLARSSRNVYLDEQQRQIAVHLNQVLREIAEKIARGAPLGSTVSAGISELLQLGFDVVDYLEIRDAETLEKFKGGKIDGAARVLAAARLGKTRLLDNMPIEKI